jgi:Flp pilus assembly protein TadB
VNPTVLLAAVCGALITGGLALSVRAFFLADPAPRPPHRPFRSRVRAAHGDRTRIGVLHVLAAVTGLIIWVASGWPVAGVAAALAVVGVPWLLGQLSKENATVDLLEALQEWLRRSADVLAAGGGLEQTLIRSLRTAPPRIEPELARLAARLQARWPTSRALLAFADDLDDAAGDLVVAALLSGAELRGPGLARVLTELAHSLTEEVTMRRKVEADRAKPRANARWILLIALAASGLAALNGNYLTPYGTQIGQLALALIVGLMVACLLWMRRLTVTPPSPRFLVGDRRAPQRSSVVEDVPVP